MEAIQKAGPVFQRPPRRNCQVKAVVSFGDLNSRVKALVENMSATGAALHFEERVDGDALDAAIQRTNGRLLMILPADRMAVEGEVVWCDHERIGVHFLEAFKPHAGL